VGGNGMVGEHRGLPCACWLFQLKAAAYKLVRLTKVLATG
jgi:hypothetical protein